MRAALGLEASSRSVTLHLREDTPLDPAKVMALVQKKASPYKLTPDMRLTRRFAEAEPPPSPLANAEALLADLGKCMKDALAAPALPGPPAPSAARGPGRRRPRPRDPLAARGPGCR